MTVFALTKSTFRTTVRLTRKTTSTLTATLRSTRDLWRRRKETSTAEMLASLAELIPPQWRPGVRGAWTSRNARFTPTLAGTQEIRLALSAAEIDGAQALRYRIFYNEMGAAPLPGMARRQRDFDRFDAACDHLVVIDHKRAEDEVVGTYRIMRREHAQRLGGFYSEAEYDLGPLLSHPGTVMELGRSCVDARYRDRATMQLLWRGISEYVNLHRVDLMFGCASLPGTDPAQLATQLSYLHHYHLAPESLRGVALPERFTPMNLLPKETLDPRRALASLPPLLKGYLRVGGFVGNGAVIDRQFNTTDVLIIVKTDLIAARYVRHYDIGTRQEAQQFREAS